MRVKILQKNERKNKLKKTSEAGKILLLIEESYKRNRKMLSENRSMETIAENGRFQSNRSVGTSGS